MRLNKYDDTYSERPVRLDNMEGYVLIEGRVYPAKELVEALLQNGYAELRASGDSLVLGRTQIPPVFKSIRERVMASLCYGSLTYCCPLSKRCVDRDRALEVLGLSPSEYERIKRECHSQFVNIADRTDNLRTQQTDEHGREYMPEDSRVEYGVRTQQYHRAGVIEPPRCTTSTTDRKERTQEDYQRIQSRDDAPQTGSVMTVQRSTVTPDTQPTTSHSNRQSCNIRREQTEGLGSLFVQGEISPFANESQYSQHIFCSSCGRTIRTNTVRCPYCGTPQ